MFITHKGRRPIEFSYSFGKWFTSVLTPSNSVQLVHSLYRKNQTQLKAVGADDAKLMFKRSYLEVKCIFTVKYIQ